MWVHVQIVHKFLCTACSTLLRIVHIPFIGSIFLFGCSSNFNKSSHKFIYYSSKNRLYLFINRL